MRYTTQVPRNIRPGIEYVYGPMAEKYGQQIVETEAVIIEDDTDRPAAQSANLNPDLAIKVDGNTKANVVANVVEPNHRTAMSPSIQKLLYETR